jgi:hypothetical protein
MNKIFVVFSNIVLFTMASLIIVNCNSNKKAYNNSGYVKEIDTLFEANTNKILSIDRTFFRKNPTVHNNLIEFKQREGETYVVVVIKKINSNDFSIFVIEDFNEFIKNAIYIMDNKKSDIIVDVDDSKSTSMMKSLSFKKGVFIRKEADKTPSVIFDLSEENLKEIEEAYNLYLNE